MPRAPLSPQYDPSAVEAATYARWQEAGVFTADPASPRAPYVIVMPPPNVTDILHMGHGLNNSLQDCFIRFERMRGRETLYLPGTDHAAIATHNVIEKQLKNEGKTRQEVGRDAFLERVYAYQKAKGGVILEQLKALGTSCDWSRTRFTMDPEYSRSVRHVFVKLYQGKLIYRGHRVIHWCPRDLTSLSDEEAEFKETDGKLYHIRYRRADGATDKGGVVVATTRPETMFGDIAVVYNETDERYAGMRGQMLEIPLSGTVIPIETSPAVEKDFGTGMLKVTPAHDPNDFEIARSLPGTPEMPIVMTEDARMADVERVPKELRGLDRFAARKKIVELLEASGQLVKVEPHRHAVRHCYRCDAVVEPRLSDQWFVAMKGMAEKALGEYRKGRLKFVPDRWGAVYENWLADIRDWNISRQIWFGHQVPAWWCPDGHVTVSETDLTTCGTCGKPAKQDPDVLDTWFSSGLWPFATLGWPKQTADVKRFYPGHTLATGPDIIFFWVARMVMLGYHFMGERPFETVVLNGIVRDAQHRKMSKSLGNGIDPLEVIARFGADALRFTVLSAAPIGTDILLDPADLETSFAPGRNFANKLWNAARFALSNMDDAPARHPLQMDIARFELADRWILSRAQRAVAATTDALERFRVNDAANEIYRFVWNDLADWYLEQVKPRLYGTVEGGDVARGVLAYVLEISLRLLHPFVPFVTEELWQHLPRPTTAGEPALLALAAWPEPDQRLVDEESEVLFARVQDIVAAVRTIRAEYSVDPGKTIPAVLTPATPEMQQAFNAEQRTAERLSRSTWTISATGPVEVSATAVLGDGSVVAVPLGDAIDVGKECARLGEELTRLQKQLTALTAKLANEQFVSRAPAAIVEGERAKAKAWAEQCEALAGQTQGAGLRVSQFRIADCGFSNRGLRIADCGLLVLGAVQSGIRNPKSAIFLTLLAACATIQPPPGGPPDLTPPALVSVTPDSGAVVPGLRKAAVFQFDEVINERALDQMVLLSPRPKGLEVSWHRSAIEVKPREGWKPDVAYRLTLLPGITDLRNNQLKTGRTLVFSTGATIPTTTLSGRVIDWEAGSAAARALVEAIRIPDSTVYWDIADSVGKFSMTAVPPGRYVFAATVDKNSNRRKDYREPFDSTVVTLDSSASFTFWSFTHDSVGPRIRTLTRSDSVTIRVDFNQTLKPASTDSTSMSVVQLPDSTPVRVTAVLTQADFDSLQTAARATTARGDTTRPGVSTPGNRALPGAPTPAAPTPVNQLPQGMSRGGLAGTPAPVDSALVKLLKERARLVSGLVIRTGTMLKPGGRYLVRARVANPSGATGESGQVLVVPALPDSTKKAR